MKNLGDITKLNGAEIPFVDIITGGSPCQDLSIAGKRKGLAGERSGLFMDQMRLIKEQRNETKRLFDKGAIDSIRPRFMVWENVPGAFSSNKGEDFRCVLEETAKVVQGDACIPGPPGDKWPHSGCIMGDGWSIAWRVHDAQFWGVPQRRKRIALVADFGGESAPEILFERKGMSGDITESGKEGEGVASDAGADIEKTSRAISFQERAGKPGGGKGILIQDERTGALSTLNNQSVCIGIDAYNHTVSGDVAATLNAASGESPTHSGPSVMTFEPGAASRLGGHCYNNTCGTLRTDMGDNQPAVCYGISSYDSYAMKSDNPHSGVYEADTSRTLDLNGGNPACNQGGMAVVCLEGNGSRPSHKGDGFVESDTMYTLNSTEHHAVCIENHPADSRVKISEDGVVQALSKQMGTGGNNVPPLTATDYKDPIKISTYQKVTGCLDCGITKGTGNQLASNDMFVANTSVVRRLTPLECERLQGYPDGWTDIGEWMDSKGKKRKDSDSPRYKALGNSIALPFWQWMAHKMVKYIDGHQPTMASLFDGIGGFPLVFSRAGAKPIWASEIEEFPIAVTKIRFPEEKENK